METRALRFHGPGDVRLERLDLSAPRPGEVVVAVEASGVCGSDLHFVAGSARPGALPVTLGHEIAGHIAESADPRWAAGDRVVVGPATPCGRCPMCGQERSNLCERRRLIGVDFDGGLADAVVAAGDALIAPPQGVPASAAATALGADEAIHATAGVSVGREVRLLSDGGADVALEFVGGAATVDAAVKSLRPGGRAVAAGVGIESLTTLAPVVWSANEYELRGAFGSLPGDIERVLAWLADGTLSPPHTTPVTLADAAGAVLAAAQEPPEGRMVVHP